MTNEHDTLARLVAFHDHIAVPPYEVANDVRRGRRRVRRNRGLLTAGAALSLAGVMVAASLLDSTHPAAQPIPMGPRPTNVTPSPTVPTGWTGPLGPSQTHLPTVVQTEPPDLRGLYSPADGPDADAAGIDIRRVEVDSGGLGWHLQLGGPPVRGSAHGPQQIIAYGLVFDADEDRVADCQIGLSYDPTKEIYRVWVENLKTGVKDERVGPPYGFPVEFVAPAEALPADGPEMARSMWFAFLSNRTAPCDPFKPSTSFYAWTSLTIGSTLTAWDYAPDAAWFAPR